MNFRCHLSPDSRDLAENELDILESKGIYSRDGDGAILRIALDSDFQVRVGLQQTRLCHAQESKLVQSIAGVTHKFSKEYLLVTVETVDNQIQ